MDKAVTDRISNLPDNLRSDIIGRLPLDCSVRTSILSTKWKDIWKSTVSDIDIEFPVAAYDSEDFGRMVRSACSCISETNSPKVRLHGSTIVSSEANVNRHVDEVINRNVREIEVHLPFLPLSIFRSRSLRTLKVHIPHGSYTDLNNFDLPNLKVLNVDKPGPHAKTLLENMIRNCTALEDVSITGSLGYSRSGEVFRLIGPVLKSLQLMLWGSGNCDLYLEAPKLKHIYLNEYMLKYKIHGNLSSLTTASIRIGEVPLGLRLLYRHEQRASRPLWEVLLQLLDCSPRLKVVHIEHGLSYEEQQILVDKIASSGCRIEFSRE